MSYEIKAPNLIPPYPHAQKIKITGKLLNSDVKYKIVFKITREFIKICGHLQDPIFFKFYKAEISCKDEKLAYKINCFVQNNTQFFLSVIQAPENSNKLVFQFFQKRSETPSLLISDAELRVSPLLSLTTPADVLFAQQSRQADPALSAFHKNYLDKFLTGTPFLEKEIPELLVFLHLYNHSERSQILVKVLESAKGDILKAPYLVSHIFDFSKKLLLLIYKFELTYLFSVESKDLSSFSNFGVCYLNAQDTIVDFLSVTLQVLNHKFAPIRKEDQKNIIKHLNCTISILELVFLCNYSQYHSSSLSRISALVKSVTSRYEQSDNLRIFFLSNYLAELYRLSNQKIPTVSILFKFVELAKQFRVSEDDDWRKVAQKLDYFYTFVHSVGFWWEHLFLLKSLFLVRENFSVLKKMEAGINYQLRNPIAALADAPFFPPGIQPLFIQGLLEICVLYIHFAEAEEWEKVELALNIFHFLGHEKLDLLCMGFLRQHRQSFKDLLRQWHSKKMVKFAKTHPSVRVRGECFVKLNLGEFAELPTLSRSLPAPTLMYTEVMLDLIPFFSFYKKIESHLVPALNIRIINSTPRTTPYFKFFSLVSGFLEEKEPYTNDCLIFCRNHPIFATLDVLRIVKKIWDQFTSSSWVTIWLSLNEKNPQIIFNEFFHKLNLKQEDIQSKMKIFIIWEDVRKNSSINASLIRSLFPQNCSSLKILLITPGSEHLPTSAFILNSKRDLNFPHEGLNFFKFLTANPLRALHAQSSQHSIHPFIHELEGLERFPLEEVFVLKYNMGSTAYKITINIDRLSASKVRVKHDNLEIVTSLSFAFRVLNKAKFAQLLQNIDNFDLSAAWENQHPQVELICRQLVQEEEEVIKYYNKESFGFDTNRLRLEANWCEDPYQGEERKKCLRHILQLSKGKPQFAIAAGNALSVLVRTGETFEDLRNVVATSAVISEGNFANVCWDEAILTDIEAYRVNLRKCSMRGAVLKNIDFGIWPRLNTTGPLVDMRLSPNNHYLALVTAREITIWDLKSSTGTIPFTKVVEIPGNFNCVQFSPDAKLLVLGSKGKLIIYSLEQSKEIYSLAGNVQLNQIHFSPNYSFLVLVYENTVKVFEFVSKMASSRHGIMLHELRFEHKAASHLLFSTTTSLMYLTTPGRLQSWVSFYRCSNPLSLEHTLLLPYVVKKWVFSNQGYHLIASCPDAIRVCKKSTLSEPLCVVPIPTEPLWVHVDDQTQTLMMVFANGLLMQYTLTDPPLLTLKKRISDIPIGKIGGLFQDKYLIVASSDQRISFIEIHSRSEQKRLIKEEIFAVKISNKTKTVFLFSHGLIVKYDPFSLDHFSSVKTKINYQTFIKRLDTASSVKESAHYLAEILHETPFPVNSFFLNNPNANKFLKSVAVDKERNFLTFAIKSGIFELWNLHSTKEKFVCTVQFERLANDFLDDKNCCAGALEVLSKDQMNFMLAVADSYAGLNVINIYNFYAFDQLRTKLLKSIECRASVVNLQFLLSRNQLFILDSNHELKCYSLEAGNNTPIFFIKLNEHHCMQFSIHEKTNILIINTMGGRILLFDISSKTQLTSIQEDVVFREVELSDDGLLLCAVDETGFSLFFWDLKREGDQIRAKLRRKIPQTFNCRDMEFTPDNVDPYTALLLTQNGASKSSKQAPV